MALPSYFTARQRPAPMPAAPAQLNQARSAEQPIRTQPQVTGPTNSPPILGSQAFQPATVKMGPPPAQAEREQRTGGSFGDFIQAGQNTGLVQQQFPVQPMASQTLQSPSAMADQTMQGTGGGAPPAPAGVLMGKANVNASTIAQADDLAKKFAAGLATPYEMSAFLTQLGINTSVGGFDIMAFATAGGMANLLNTIKQVAAGAMDPNAAISSLQTLGMGQGPGKGAPPGGPGGISEPPVEPPPPAGNTTPPPPAPPLPPIGGPVLKPPPPTPGNTPPGTFPPPQQQQSVEPPPPVETQEDQMRKREEWIRRMRSQQSQQPGSRPGNLPTPPGRSPGRKGASTFTGRSR